MNPLYLDLTFWQQVRNEYQNHWCNYICNASTTFKEAWQHFALSLQIRRLANEFLIPKDMEPNANSRGYLFLSSSRQLRLKFIDWNIQRLSN